MIFLFDIENSSAKIVLKIRKEIDNVMATSFDKTPEIFKKIFTVDTVRKNNKKLTDPSLIIKISFFLVQIMSEWQVKKKQISKLQLNQSTQNLL